MFNETMHTQSTTHASTHVNTYTVRNDSDNVDDNDSLLNGPRQANLVLIAYASSEDSGEPAHPRSLARTFAVRSYKQ